MRRECVKRDFCTHLSLLVQVIYHSPLVHRDQRVPAEFTNNNGQNIEQDGASGACWDSLLPKRRSRGRSLKKPCLRFPSA